MPSKSMSPMPMQAKIGDASLKFGPDWLRALSSDTGGTGGPAPPGGPASGGGGPVHNSWASGAGGGGGTSGLFADRHAGHNSGAGFSTSSNSSHHHHLSHSQSWASASFKDGKSPPNFGGSGSLPVPAAPTTPSKFKLSEFRYSREEMLALFDKNLDAPVYLPAFGNLFIEKTQTPLAFSQASEEELRIWHIAQPESSRQAGGQAGGTGGPGGPPPVGRGGFTMRGRGGPGVERGRGRGRGGGTAGGYYTSRPHEEEDRGGYRPRGFERSQSAHERVWGDRNGTVAGPGPSPPEENAPRGGSWRTREGFGGGGGGGGTARRHDEEDAGWRSSKPRWRRDDEDDSPRGPGQRRPHRSWSDDGGHDIPEWAKDNPCEESGTFDASGAFHGEDRQASSNSTGPGAKSSHTEDFRRDDSKTKHESEPSKGSHGDNDRVQKRTPERNDSRLTIPPVKEEHEPDVDVKTASLDHRQDYPPSASRQNSHKAPSEQELRREDTKILASATSAPKMEDRSRQQNVLQNRDEIFRQTANTQHVGGVKVAEEDHFYSMTEEADNLVAKLIDDDLTGAGGHGSPPIDNVLQAFANHSAIIASKTQQQVNVGALNITAGMLHAEAQQVKSHPVPGTHGISPAAYDTWLYRDPQGSVQGPFATHEMAQWYAQGYFSGNLLLRRDCDSKFITLADMCKMYKRNPFIPIPDASPPPPIIEPSALGQPDPIQSQMQMQYQQQLMQMHREQQIQQQSQQFMMNLAHNLGRGNAKAEEPSPWQGQGGGDRRMTESDALLANISKNQAGNLSSGNQIEHLHSALQRQLQAQGKSGGDSQSNQSADFLRSLIQQQPGSQPIDMRKSPVQSSDPIQTLMQKLTNMANSQQQPQQRPPAASKVENPTSQQLPQMWGHPNQNSGVSQQPNQHQQQQQQPGMPWMGGNQMWDYREQIMGMQQRQMNEKDMRLKDEEIRRKREEELAEQDAMKRQEEARRLEEEKRKQIELEMLKQQEERQREERKQAEISRQKEIQRQEMLLQQQQQRMQLEQQQRMEQQRAEQQRQEQQRLEQQRLQQQRMHELEEQQRLEKQKHMEREQQELQAKIQQQERMAWQQKQNALLAKQQPPRSLIEIQQEEAMKQQQEEMIRQQQLKKQMQEQAEQQRQAQLQAQKSGFNLKWAQAAGPQGSPKIKSLTEIQAEEQAKLAKQQEKQRQDQAVYHQHQQSQQSWSSALTWANRASMSASNKANGSAWDEPAAAPAQQQASTKPKATSPSNFGPSPSRQAQPGNSANSQSQTAAAKRKEAEDSLLRLFQDHTAQQSQQTPNVVKPDEFSRWCNDALSSISATVDIPVFIGFLKEVESPYEVTDYVKLYVGEGREAKDFAKEFLERRSRWRNINKKGGMDGNGGSLQGFDLDGSGNSSSGLGGQSANDFQEVKGKGKKNKKGKMQKVDSKILGFSTAGAPDRLNVGKRDYGEFE